MTLSNAAVPALSPPPLDMGIWKLLFELTKTNVLIENWYKINAIDVVEKKFSSASRNYDVLKNLYVN